MASELDSFLFKFKNLWNTGRNVKLTMEAKAGKANVTLCIREDDIIYTLEELFPSKNFSLLSRVRLRPLDADHECTVALLATAGQSYIWPEMIGIQSKVCRELRRTN